jgi:hypothetical protein
VEVAVDISTPETREARRATAVAGTDLSVAHFVPFFLSPTATIWQGIITGAKDPRLSADAKRAAASDFVLLISTVKALVANHATDEETPTSPYVVTDGDAAGATTRFGVTLPDADALLRRMRADEESKLIERAELLVAGSVAFDQIMLVGVANDRARDAVKAILQEASYSVKAVVYPPWFRPAELAE